MELKESETEKKRNQFLLNSAKRVYKKEKNDGLLVGCS